jgi:signal transduction histidine kinase
MARVAGVVAHELNNYLTVILGHSDLLLGRLGPQDAAWAPVQDIQHAASQALALCQQLLDFSRPREPQIEALDLNVLVSQLERQLRPILHSRVRLTTSLEYGATKFRGDPVELERAIINLALNARDAMPEGGELRLETRCEGDWAVLVVKDNGVGMDVATRSRIFEPFFTTKPWGQGTGLGLVAVSRAMEHCGGRIEVESEPGHGSRFVLYLPCVEEKA